MKRRKDKYGELLVEGQRVLATHKGQTKAVTLISLGYKHAVVDWKKDDEADPKFVKIPFTDIVKLAKEESRPQTTEPMVVIGQVVELLPRNDKDELGGLKGRVIDVWGEKATVLIPAEEWGGSSAISPIWQQQLLRSVQEGKKVRIKMERQIGKTRRFGSGDIGAK